MKLTDRVHRIEATRGSHAYLVLGDEPMLIDTGLPGRGDRILAELASHGLRPGDLAHILLTHHDIDHIGNARFLQEATGATLWAPKDDLPFIEGTCRRPGLKGLADAIVKVNPPRGLRTFEAGQRIGDLEIIPTPGHTPGHTSLRLDDMLFAGDLIGSAKGKLRMISTLLVWDAQALRNSLEEVGKLSFDWVFPAHGDPVRRGGMWEALLKS
ncbi:putative metallo-hydrolase YflN [compost metagenome]